MILLATSLFFTTPAPLDMPRASAYLVREGDVRRLEDRYNRQDLWVSQSVDGRWMDDEGRVFMLAHLDSKPPAEDAAESVVAREDFARARQPIDRRDLESVATAVAALSPVAIDEKGRPPHQMPRGFKDVDYWQGTNRTTIVCAFLPEKASVWQLATWQLAEGDDYDACLKSFEKEFFETVQPFVPEDSKKVPPERDLLRRDARHSVSAYDNWHVTDAPTFTVLDDLPRDSSFVTALTNELVSLQAQFVRTLPTPLDGTNTLCVARLFASRDEYLDALETEGLTNMSWSAAYWCQQRRELVAYLPEAGERELLKTFRHEAFHQYLSYASSMIPTAPWLNEGYAQYFEEDASDRDWFRTDAPTPDDVDRLSALLPALFAMDYEAFYEGSDNARHLKYRLARSVVQFLEKGAPKVRFAPFAKMKADYFESLLETSDMQKATAAAFGNAEKMKLFVAEWVKYWKCTSAD